MLLEYIIRQNHVRGSSPPDPTTGSLHTTELRGVPLDCLRTVISKARDVVESRWPSLVPRFLVLSSHVFQHQFFTFFKSSDGPLVEPREFFESSALDCRS